MHLSTPPQPRFRPSTSSGSGTPYTPTNARSRGVFRPSQLGATASTTATDSSDDGSSSQTPRRRLMRDRGTPVGKLLAREGMSATPARASPRKVRHRSWTQKAQDWPANFIMSVETSIQLWSFDSAAYPAAVALHVVHLVVRLPVLTAALPPWLRIGSHASATSSRFYATAQELADADARLAALQRQASGHLSWSWMAAGVSVVLVLLSVVNTAYLFSRRRKYQLVLRKDPLASPNARTANLDFASTTDTPTLFARIKRTVVNRFKTPREHTPQQFQVQELNVWTPDHVQWSLRLFMVYPPPVALMYHVVTPSSFLPFVVTGSATVALAWFLVHLFTTLLSDRALLQAEVMHEYNAKFVNPRLFVAKRDAATSTSDLEFAEWRSAMAEDQRGPDSGRAVSVYSATESELGTDAMDALVRGSGRKPRRRP
ncbi:hypothetical protein OIV83_001861 [Microbotryomycetes sp. JL201]|nr:hypothetical protein OIV83_001861 [Microbotryomycetes sp. JL201]